MKKILLLITVITCFSAAAQWTLIPSGTTQKIDAIHFRDSMFGLCSGGFVSTLYTTNGGFNWTMSSEQGFRDYSFSDSANGYGASVVGQSIAKTNDSGANWTSVTPPTSNSLWGVATTSPTTAHFVGTGGVYWRTLNGGSSFSTMTLDASVLLTDIVFTSIGKGFIAMQSGIIKKTVNGGFTWTTAYDASTICALTEMSFPTADVGYVAGNQGHILKTTDGGTTWTFLTTNATTHFQGIDFYDVDRTIR